MSQLDSYLYFDGNCAEAMRFYERTLGGKLQMMLKNSEAPAEAQCPEGTNGKDRIMHACINLDGRLLMASDWMGEQKYPGMGGFSLSLNYPTVKEARQAFDALADGGQVRMPLDKTFWVEAFGMLVDKFGTPWMIGGGKQLMN